MIRVKGDAPTFILVGNKADKSSEREVLKEDGARYARELGCEFLETSARTAYNVDRLFSTLIRTLRNNRDGGPAMNDAIVPNTAVPVPGKPLKHGKKSGKKPNCVIA